MKDTMQNSLLLGRSKDPGLPDRAPNRAKKDLQILLEVILPACVSSVSLG